MTPTQERLHSHLQRLKLHRMEQVLATVAEDATKTQLSYTDFLTQLLEAEVDEVVRGPVGLVRLGEQPAEPVAGGQPHDLELRAHRAIGRDRHRPAAPGGARCAAMLSPTSDPAIRIYS